MASEWGHAAWFMDLWVPLLLGQLTTGTSDVGCISERGVEPQNAFGSKAETQQD